MGLEPAASLKIRHSPENITTPAQSEAVTTESEAQGLDTVHSLFFALLLRAAKCLGLQTRQIPASCAP
ncbi:hypothetical protein CXZ05_21590 [Arthrobacter sp. AFG20]|nr:hypothetical protein CXZ05_21590 [Arthrobacter sp. AFG20]